MNTRRTGVRRLIAGTAALGLGLTGALALGAPAFADVGPDQPNAPTQGTLTINKYAGAPLGEGETLEDREPLNGVEFTVTPVGLSSDAGCTAIDLTVAAQWDGLDGLFASGPAAPEAPFCLVTADAEADVTDSGSVVFDLPVGVYFVSETDPGANPIVSSVPDFYVAIPTSATSGADGWTYDVVADPKNQLMEGPTKVIDAEQTDMVVGGEVDWTITVPIPTLNNDELFTSASVTDVLDARLSYASSTLSIGDETLVADTDYTVDAGGGASPGPSPRPAAPSSTPPWAGSSQST
ncbi:isopeptide-forming domain-containing fimbrial protein [Tessaracoccus sp. HDW20]|uniref:SpaH/EbpB family LPXTG-anchored major pilin n=1 Tax=Tessaracoccus coleopterorum TaxID=2714950 RepID=UPI0018D382D5|nr:SpaH/EbpB family LPXTG-anchored major pilin [Tessaracoccus coleopterorum]NHB85094.1 isopeptide-forming domain-containing fimbrial protein [Tessaracoccus coleopterorum]